MNFLIEDSKIWSVLQAIEVLGIGYVIIGFPKLIIVSIRHGMDPYFRTEKGEELNRQLEGLKVFLKDYSNMDDKSKDDVVIWEDYLVYSVLFNQNTTIIEEYKQYFN